MALAPLLAGLCIHVLCEFVPAYPHPEESPLRRWSRIAGRLAGLLAACWTLGLAAAVWPLALALTIAHAIADDATDPGAGLAGLVRDQLLHVAAIVLFAIAAGLEIDASRLVLLLRSRAIWTAVSGFTIAVFVGGVVVGRIVQPFASALESSLAGRATGGLARAGRLIGLLERSLIFVSICLGLSDLVGFVVAAKAILRFPEAREGSRELSEYYVVGTLASVSWAIAVAVATRGLLGHSG